MKKTILYFAVLLITFHIISSVSYGQANTSLSNLNVPTSVNVDVLPGQNNKRNLGSAGKSWQVIFLDSSIYLKDSIFIHSVGVRSTYMGEKAGGSAKSSMYDNTAIGFNSLRYSTSGNHNSALGTYTLFHNSTGSDNCAIGYTSLSANTTGTGNVAIGSFSLYDNTTGESNTALGTNSMGFNIKGNYNTATGFSSLFYNTAGSENTANGYNALNSVTTGSGNTGIGTSALATTTTQSNSTALGFFAGWSYYGNNNTFIGSSAVANAYNFSNSSAFGNQALITASNQVRVGNTSVTSIGGQVSWSTLSDGRVKKNINQNVPGLSFINKLKPVTYNLDLDAFDNITKPALLKDNKGNIITPSQQDIEARKAKEQFVYTGLIAQDVETAAKESSYDFSGVDVAKNDKDLYGLRYSDFVMPLIKAVQELSKENDDLKARLEKVESLLASNSDQSTQKNIQSVTLQQQSKLEQNIPNPVSGITIINYTLPSSYTNAQIVITDKSGNTLNRLNINGSGKGSLKLNASSLINGTYNYSLFVNGKLIDTKQMERLK